MAASTPTVDTRWQADEPGALGIDKILQQVSQDDQDEWEYEYSTTETETYYLTLELSYPEFKERPAKAPHHSRGGYYKNWLDQYSDGPAAKPITHGLGQEDQSDNDNEPIPEPEADDDLPHLDPMLRASDAGNPADTSDQPNKKLDKGKGRADEQEKEPGGETEDTREPANEKIEEIQILELHSRNPIISYRGRVFEGQWAEVIGTEAIIADRKDDDPNPLPALRRLPGGVDILGACSSRILTTEKIPKPKIPEEDSLAATRKEWNIRIPPGKDRTGERAHQIRFLENLMALKKKKGQKDDVTVYAMDGDGKDFNDKKGPDFKPRKRKPAPGLGLPDDGSSQSSVRERRRSARRLGRQSARRRNSARGTAAAGERGKSSTSGSTVLSTPTPSHWDELVTREDEEDVEEEDYDDDDEDGDNSLDDISEESEGPDGGEETHDDDDEDVTMEG